MRRHEDALGELSSHFIQSGDQGEAERRAEPKKTE